MTSKYNRSVFLIIVISLCLSVFSKAQTPQKDSVTVKQKQAVNIAYGTQPAWMVTGAISTVNGSDIQSPFTSNFTSRLFGRIPGLSVVTGGSEPGNENTSLFSRGINTFGVGVTRMLVLVDGIESSITDLTPEEVESVSFHLSMFAAVRDQRYLNFRTLPNCVLVKSRRQNHQHAG